MSETDDTDVLLLIPPDFFLVQSSSSEDSFLESSRTVVHKPLSSTVLGRLVTQVHSLESRLQNLELNATNISDNISTYLKRDKTCETDSFSYKSSGRKCFTFPRRRRRKVFKERCYNLSITSDSTSTHCGNISPVKLKSNIDIGSKLTENYINDSQIMDCNLSSITSTPSKNDKLILHEIDDFLRKVESCDISDHKSQSTFNSENVTETVDDSMYNKLPSEYDGEVTLPSGRTISRNILNKYIYLLKNNTETSKLEKPILNKTQYTTGAVPKQPSDSNYKTDNDPAKQAYKMKSSSVRTLNFLDVRNNILPTSTPKKNSHSNSTSVESCSPLLNTPDFRCHIRKMFNEEFKPPKKYFNVDRDWTYNSPKQQKKTRSWDHLGPPKSDDLDGIKTIGNVTYMKRRIPVKVSSVKLDEERLKRGVCVAKIERLQKKILDLQEKLAVTLKADRQKDLAISELREASLKLTSRLNGTEEQNKEALDNMNQKMENLKLVADDAQKKTDHFEKEMYKALDLAHDYQNKCKKLIMEKNTLQQDLEKNITNSEEIIKNKEKSIETLKEKYETSMKLNKQSTDYIKSLEDSIQKERSDHELTKGKINELYCKIQSVNEEILLTQQERDILKDKVNEERARCNTMERQLCEKQNQVSELLKKCDYLDGEVKALHRRLEIQKNEIRAHYQKQLEEALMTKLDEFQQQLHHAEKEMENNAKIQEHTLTDTYNKQIARIEEQHKLEINILEEKHKEEIKLYRLQLVQASENIGLLQNKVESYRRRRGEIASQLHSVMESQWRKALNILTSSHGNASSVDQTLMDSASTPLARETLLAKRLPLTMPALANKGLSSDDLRQNTNISFENLSENELQQYIKTVLTKCANFDDSGDNLPLQLHKDLGEEPTSDRPDKQERKLKSCRQNLNSKPPWKS